LAPIFLASEVPLLLSSFGFGGGLETTSSSEKEKDLEWKKALHIQT
jgi:hypothetical protein